MKTKILLAVSAIILAGCATSSKMVGPNGKEAHSIRCGAAVPGACYEKAGEVCPGGYNILTGSGSQYLGQYGTGSVNGVWNRQGGFVTGSATSMPIITPNSLIVECK